MSRLRHASCFFRSPIGRPYAAFVACGDYTLLSCRDYSSQLPYTPLLPIHLQVVRQNFGYEFILSIMLD